MEEKWDLYDSAGRKTGRTLLRGVPIPAGCYHLVVSVWIVNQKGRYLLSQRHPEKQYPLFWECTGGNVLSGEDSFNGALREVKEELGISLNPADAKFICRQRRERTQDFYDVWLFRTDIKLSEIRMQADEVAAVKWVSGEKLLDMFQSGELHPLLVVNGKRGGILGREGRSNGGELS